MCCRHSRHLMRSWRWAASEACSEAELAGGRTGIWPGLLKRMAAPAGVPYPMGIWAAGCGPP